MDLPTWCCGLPNLEIISPQHHIAVRCGDGRASRRATNTLNLDHTPNSGPLRKTERANNQHSESIFHSALSGLFNFTSWARVRKWSELWQTPSSKPITRLSGLCHQLYKDRRHLPLVDITLISSPSFPSYITSLHFPHSTPQFVPRSPLCLSASSSYSSFKPQNCSSDNARVSQRLLR